MPVMRDSSRRNFHPPGRGSAVAQPDFRKNVFASAASTIGNLAKMCIPAWA